MVDLIAEHRRAICVDIRSRQELADDGHVIKVPETSSGDGVWPGAS
jgi:hypothetical protein